MASGALSDLDELRRGRSATSARAPFARQGEACCRPVTVPSSCQRVRAFSRSSGPVAANHATRTEDSGSVSCSTQDNESPRKPGAIQGEIQGELVGPRGQNLGRVSRRVCRRRRVSDDREVQSCKPWEVVLQGESVPRQCGRPGTEGNSTDLRGDSFQAAPQEVRLARGVQIGLDRGSDGAPPASDLASPSRQEETGRTSSSVYPTQKPDEPAPNGNPGRPPSGSSCRIERGVPCENA